MRALVARVRRETVVLGIPDIYYHGHPELVRLIKEKVSNYLNRVSDHI